MARPKAFDPEHAVDAAMQAFWRTGYDGTSIDDLTRACGIGRGSMYATFGSKNALYERSLKHYQRTEGATAFACLEGPGGVHERIERLFAHFATTALEDPENRGCFLLNAAMERAPHDPAVARRVRDGLRVMQRALRELLFEAQATGELAADRDPERLAGYLVTALNGGRVTAKATQDTELVESAIGVALEALGPRPAD